MAGDSEKGNRGEARKQSRRTEKTTGARQIQNNVKKGNWRRGGRLETESDRFPFLVRAERELSRTTGASASCQRKVISHAVDCQGGISAEICIEGQDKDDGTTATNNRWRP
jgi:hypothetical protein